MGEGGAGNSEGVTPRHRMKHNVTDGIKNLDVRLSGSGRTWTGG
jgi:hypothetical protein